MRRVADPQWTCSHRGGRRVPPGLDYSGETRGKMIKKIQTFGAEVKQEMQKVTWPSREELMGSTGVVLTTMLILSVFIGVVDFVMTSALSLILR